MEAKLGPILQQLVKERGANMVLDKQAVVFATAGGFDITGDAINQLNQKMPSLKVNFNVTAAGRRRSSKPQKAGHGRSPLFRKSRPLHPGADLRKSGHRRSGRRRWRARDSSISPTWPAPAAAHLTFFSGDSRGARPSRASRAGACLVPAKGKRPDAPAGMIAAGMRFGHPMPLPPSRRCSIPNIRQRVWPQGRGRDLARWRGSARMWCWRRAW